MLTLYSFLQKLSLSARTMTKGVSKRIRGQSTIFVSFVSVLAIVALTSSGFGSNGKDALTVFAETNSSANAETEESLEEIEAVTEANIQVNLTDSRRQGQLLVGELLTQEIQQKEADRLQAQEKIEEAKKQELLEEENAKKAGSAAPYSEEDYEVLLRIVQAEAGICDDKGKILVANVILNRVESKEFPNTIKGVVYQRSQFSPVANGSINTCKVTPQTVECVNRALSGEDYSQGALYFMNRSGARSRAANWFDGHLTFLFRHERHEFFK